MGSFIQDFGYAVRALRKNPGFTAVAILTLGLGIGANTAIFSVVNGVILKPLDYREPGGLVMIASQFPTMGFDKFWMSPPEYRELQEWSRSFEVIGAYRIGNASVGTETEPLRVTSAIATAEFFQALGVAPILGRTFSMEEDAPGGDPVAVLSHELWDRAYGGDPGIVGETILMDGEPTTVIGVMPEGFDIDEAGVELWAPVQLDPATFPNRRGNHFLFLVGRLNSGVTLAQARSELGALLIRWEEEFPDGHTPSAEFHRLVMSDLQEEVVGGVRPALLILLSAVGFVLLIAVANVGNLLLARAESRQKEIAVRVALGAGGRRLLRQFLTESTLLGLLGGVVGLGVAFAGLELLVLIGPGSIPRLGDIGMDSTVLGFTLLISVVTGVLFGLAPILHLNTEAATHSLREGSGRTTVGRGRHRVRGLLVVTEVALAVILAIGSGLLIRSFGELQRVDPGFDVAGLLTFELYLPSSSYPTPTDRADFLARLDQDLRGLPGVLGASAMSGLPPQREVNANDTRFEGVERTEDGPSHNTDYWQFVGQDYFDVMGIEMVAGRAFESADGGSEAGVLIINERLAEVFYGWPDNNPIGRRIDPLGGPEPLWLTIVGIAEDVKQGGLDSETGTELYFYYPQTAAVIGFAPQQMHITVRTQQDPLLLAGEVREVVWGLDAALPVANVTAMEEHLSGTLARPRFLALLLMVFAGVALALSAVGTYGVISYSVAERSREIGIRVALGASSADVLNMVLVSGGRLAIAGLALGVLGAFVLTKLMASLLYGVGTTDPLAFVVAPGVLALVALAACLIPARRATRVDPVVVLKGD